MTQKLHPAVVSLSLVTVSIVLSLLCAVFIALAPEFSIIFFGSIFHGLDISKIAAPVTISGVITGLVAITIVAGFSGWMFSAIYNYFAAKIK